MSIPWSGTVSKTRSKNVKNGFSQLKKKLAVVEKKVSNKKCVFLKDELNEPKIAPIGLIVFLKNAKNRVFCTIFQNSITHVLIKIKS